MQDVKHSASVFSFYGILSTPCLSYNKLIKEKAVIVLKLKYLIFYSSFKKDTIISQKLVSEIKKETFIFDVYILIFVKVIQKRGQTSRMKLINIFWPLSTVFSFFLHANIGQPMTDQECHTKIIFFLKRGQSAIWHLESSRLANILSCYEGILKFSWGDVMEWISLPIDYINLYCFLFNSLYDQVIWN